MVPETGVPRSRGVTGASRTMNQRLADMTNDNLAYMLKSDPNNEVGSTEQLLYNVDNLNKMIGNGSIDSQNLVTGSLDVSNLYGSINVKKATQLVRERALKTKCKWKGIDLRWALIYLALTLKPWEKVNFKLVDILPRRQCNKNKYLTIATVNLDETKDRWWLPTLSYGLLGKTDQGDCG